MNIDTIHGIIGQHPDNQWPLRAWLIEQGRMVETEDYRISRCPIGHYNRPATHHIIRFYDVPDCKSCYTISVAPESDLKVEAILLHATNVTGQKVCEEG